MAIALGAGSVPAVAASIDGFTEPYRTVNVAAAETGIVRQIHVAEGERVKQGQLLATLDLEVLETTLDVAKARARAAGAIHAARAEYQLAKTKADKLRTLRQQGHVSEAELERAETDLAVAEAKVLQTAEDQEIAALDCKRIESQIERRRIRSPIDGFVTKVRKEVGEAVLLTDPSVITLVDLDRLRAKFPVSIRQASGLRAGQEVNVSLPDLGKRVPAKVEVVAPVADAKSGTVQVTVAIDNREGQYRGGARCLLQLPDDPDGPDAKTPLKPGP